MKLRVAGLVGLCAWGGCDSAGVGQVIQPVDMSEEPAPCRQVDGRERLEFRVTELRVSELAWNTDEPWDDDGTPPDVALCHSFDNVEDTCVQVGEGSEFTGVDQRFAGRADRFNIIRAWDLDYEPETPVFDAWPAQHAGEVRGIGGWGVYPDELSNIVGCGPVDVFREEDGRGLLKLVLEVTVVE